VSDAAVYALLGALVAGIGLGELLGASSAAAVLALGVGVLATALAIRRRRGFVLALVGALLVGSAVMARALDGLERWPLTAAVAARSDVVLTGSLVGDPEGTRFSTSALVRISAAAVAGGDGWTRAGGRTVLVRADGDIAQRVRLLSSGDTLTLAGWLRPLEGFDERLRWRHVIARFDATDVLAFTPASDWLARAANGLRSRVLSGTRTLPPTERGVVAAFLVGDTRDLPREVVERFRAAGISHLLVVSGSNVAFVLALLSPLLRRLPRRGRFLAGLVVLVVFGAMTRWEPSVLRACAMAACAMAGVVLGRPVAGRRVLALGVGALLVVDPFLIRSVGFLLSCGACVGILFAGARLVDRCPGPAGVRTVLGTTAAAQLGVAPVLLPVFGSIPLVSLPANLVAIPLAAPLTTFGLVGGLVGGIVPGLAGLVNAPVRVLADGMLGIADLAAREPLTLDRRGALGVGALCALGAAFVLARRLRRHGSPDAALDPASRGRAVVVPPR
jgi:competence protein ComEC